MNSWAALLTPPLPGAVAVWAVRGHDSWHRIASSMKPLMGRDLEHGVIPTHARLTRWNILSGTQGDEVLVIPRERYPIPWFEIHGHSGPELLRCQTHWFVTNGFRIASPESFGFWVEKDRLAGEVNHCLTKVLTRKGVEGILGQSNLCRSTLSDCSGWLERGMWNPALEAINKMARGYLQAKAWTSGWKVALCGPPNAGKSTLMNALLGTGRSLVSNLPGTTRDAVHAMTVLDGWVVELIDMAGWRQSEDPLELAGIKLGKALIESADLVVMLSEDGPNSWNRSDSFKLKNAIHVWTKSDLRQSVANDENLVLNVSAHTGRGIDELAKRIVDNLTDNGNLPSGPVAFSSLLKESMIQAVAAINSRKFDEAARIIGQWLEPVPQPTEVDQ